MQQSKKRYSYRTLTLELAFAYEGKLFQAARRFYHDGAFDVLVCELGKPNEDVSIDAQILGEDLLEESDNVLEVEAKITQLKPCESKDARVKMLTVSTDKKA